MGLFFVFMFVQVLFFSQADIEWNENGNLTGISIDDGVGMKAAVQGDGGSAFSGDWRWHGGEKGGTVIRMAWSMGEADRMKVSIAQGFWRLLVVGGEPGQKGGRCRGEQQ